MIVKSYVFLCEIKAEVIKKFNNVLGINYDKILRIKDEKSWVTYIIMVKVNLILVFSLPEFDIESRLFLKNLKSWRVHCKVIEWNYYSGTKPIRIKEVEINQ